MISNNFRDQILFQSPHDLIAAPTPAIFHSNIHNMQQFSNVRNGYYSQISRRLLTNTFWLCYFIPIMTPASFRSLFFLRSSTDCNMHMNI